MQLMYTLHIPLQKNESNLVQISINISVISSVRFIQSPSLVKCLSLYIYCCISTLECVLSDVTFIKNLMIEIVFMVHKLYYNDYVHELA